MTKFYLFLGLALLVLNLNAQTWTPVGTGVNSSVDVLNVYNGQLVAAGRYSSMTKWNGTTWTDVAASGNPTATSIFVDGNDMYAGGQFTGGEIFKTISHYNGSAWSVVGGSTSAYNLVNWNTNNRWWSIFKYNSQLYGIYDGGILRFDNALQEFVNVGDQTADLGSLVFSMRYAGTINNVAYFSGMTDGVQRIITWNESTWDTINMSNYPIFGILDMKVFNNELYLIGGFQNTNNVVSGMIKWNGTAFTDLLGYGAGIPMMYALYTTPGHLFIRYMLGVNSVGYWNGTTITGLSGEMFGTTGSLNTVEELNGTVFAGGFFTSFTGVTANNIAKRSLAVGTEDVSQQQEMNVFPNPVVSDLELSMSDKPRNVKIYDVQGQLKMNHELLSGNSSISVTQLASGIYILNIQEGDAMHSVRFVKL